MSKVYLNKPGFDKHLGRVDEKGDVYRADVGIDDRIGHVDLETGKVLYSHKLPGYAASWGLAVDRSGRSIVTLENGQVLCFGE